ncbi:carboxy terminal-processing peptidase, partial [Oleiphilus sp. HI0125]
NSLENALPWDAIAAADFKQLASNDGVETVLNQRHEERFAKNEEYQVLLEEIALLDKQRTKDRVSLNKEVRQKEIKTAEKEQLDLENKRRSFEGKEPYADFKAWEDDVEAQASKTQSDELEV